MNKPELLSKIKWLTIIRIIVATIILGSITCIQYKETDISLFPFYTLISLTYSMTILYAIIIHFDPDPVFFAYIQLLGDIIIETALIFYTGGIRSPFSFTYIITIISSSIVLSRRSSLIMATLSSLTYSALIILQFIGFLPIPSYYISSEFQLNVSYLSHTLFANIFAFYLIALLSGHLAELQRKAGQELQSKAGDIAQLQAFNANILQSMSSGLIVTDLSGYLRLMNRAAVRILNLPYHEREQKQWNQFFQPLQLELFIQQLEKETRDSLRTESLIQKNGQKIFLGITISILKNTLGEAEGIITNFQDLTELKKMEEQVKRAEMLASIGQMSAGMAHELRNPLASIKGLVQFLHDELPLDEEHKRLMKIILKESDRLNMIITDFLTYANPKPPKIEKCCLTDLVQETITLLRNSQEYKHHINIIIDFPSYLPPLEADPDQLKQVFWNLAINACQAMPHGGTLNVRIPHDSPDLKDYLVIEFADTGIGITQEVIQNLFNPFYTTKEKGMGLGLSIAYRIIEKHNGKIEVISAPDEGSNFRIYLPYKSNVVTTEVDRL